MIRLTNEEAKTLLCYVEEVKYVNAWMKDDHRIRYQEEYAEIIETMDWLRVRIDNSHLNESGTSASVERFEEKMNSMGIEVVTVSSSFPSARNSEGA